MWYWLYTYLKYKFTRTCVPELVNYSCTMYNAMCGQTFSFNFYIVGLGVCMGRLLYEKVHCR